jgi:sec-independent protein translocase protein TatB
MFDLAWSEILVIGAVALVVIGPKDLPKVLHGIGQWVRRARQMAAEFQSGIDQMARESELEELRKKVEKAGEFVQSPMTPGSILDPDGTMRKALEVPAADITLPPPSAVEGAAAVETAPAPAPALPDTPPPAADPVVSETPRRDA